MFKSTKNQSVDAGSINLLGSGTKINGDINSNGDFRIDGLLVGNITISGKLVLGNTGRIEGNIQCTNADLSGEVKGTVNINETLSLKSTAKINGDIITSKLAIEAGAIFTGTCNMGALVKNISQKNEQKAVASQTA
ncbi:MAG: polymer-forming cytoskeletal protein [Sphingobacteriaceae bacterium]|nr:polymer-forming cytoskeletal protein [Sphingobacteriaceae bacterium]MBK7312245.1 polymer-forming cytoskeletal protein [Sphingobacteriaceae bacterium]MBK7816964.1 polymer-forming cytoskeletal protein [Sphingobacteriaceae bacterium]